MWYAGDWKGKKGGVLEGHKGDGCWYCGVDKCVFVEVLLLSPSGVFLTSYLPGEGIMLCWLISSSLSFLYVFLRRLVRI